jgi:hypothetical protein
MGYKRTYTFNRDENNGYSSCDILVQYYDSEQFKAVAIRKEDMENMDAWRMCNALQRAYDAGREDAMRDLRMLIGVQK